MTNDPVAHAVPLLEHRDDRSALLAVDRLLHDRLMDIGIELTRGIDLAHAHFLQRFQQLTMYKLHALVP